MFDARKCRTTKEMFQSLCNHIKFATNGGNIRYVAINTVLRVQFIVHMQTLHCVYMIVYVFFNITGQPLLFSLKEPMAGTIFVFGTVSS